jgi:serine/threonine protein kinase
MSRAPSSSSSSSSSSSASKRDRDRERERERKKEKEWAPRNVSLYPREESASQLGEGTYGAVFKGIKSGPRGSKEYVALKRINKESETEGFPITAIREVSILKSLDHENIVKMYDVVSSHQYAEGPGKGETKFAEKNIYMVFEFCDHDLKGLFDQHKQDKRPMPVPQIKYYLQCLLRGIDYCCRRRIIHRDIKGANILISNNGDVKIADFGLARKFRAGKRGEKPHYTPNVVTLWYRAPELLLGVSQYDHKIDVWSVGCLFAEMLCENRVLFPGERTELDQLAKIWAVMGTPTQESWPQGVDLLDSRGVALAEQPDVLRQVMARLGVQDPAAVDLLSRLLALNPDTRIDAGAALEHEWFASEPLPMRKSEHPFYRGNFHEYNTKTHQQHRKRESDAKANSQRSHEQYKDRNKRRKVMASQSASRGGYKQRGGGGQINFFNAQASQNPHRKRR